MKTKFILLTVGVVVAAAAIWYHHRVHDLLADTQRGSGELVGERAKLTGEFERAQQQLATAEHRRAELQATLDDMRKSKPTGVGEPRRKPVSTASPRDLILNDPKLQTLWLKTLDGNFTRGYAWFCTEHQLSPEQIERLKAATTKRVEALMDLAAVAKSQGPDADPAIKTMRDQAKTDYEKAAREALGEEGFRQLQHYEQTASVRTFVGSIAGTAALEDAPLSAGQADQLIQAVVNASAKPTNGGGVQIDRTDWEAVDALAREVLSPKQLDIFRRGRVEFELSSAIDRAVKADRDARG